MSVFDLLFILVFFATVAIVAVAAYSAIRGKGARAKRILSWYAIGAIAYLGSVVLASLSGERRVLSLGDPRCFDDWCITVEHVSRKTVQAGRSYTVAVRMFSQARRAFQREKGAVMYLTDDRGGRYDPTPDDGDVPLNVLLGPQESIAATRVFEVPANAHETGLVIAHESGFPIGWFIIGYETWFRKPTMLKLP